MTDGERRGRGVPAVDRRDYAAHRHAGEIGPGGECLVASGMKRRGGVLAGAAGRVARMGLLTASRLHTCTTRLEKRGNSADFPKPKCAHVRASGSMPSSDAPGIGASASARQGTARPRDFTVVMRSPRHRGQR